MIIIACILLPLFALALCVLAASLIHITLND